MSIFKAKVTRIGDKAFSLFDQESILVLFGEGIEEDIAQYCILINTDLFCPPIKKGQQLSFGGEKFSIVDFGDLAEENLKNLGHATLEFGNPDRDMLPGVIRLEGKPIRKILQDEIISIS